jgi:hypothetical protein
LILREEAITSSRTVPELSRFSWSEFVGCTIGVVKPVSPWAREAETRADPDPRASSVHHYADWLLVAANIDCAPHLHVKLVSIKISFEAAVLCLIKSHKSVSRLHMSLKLRFEILLVLKINVHFKNFILSVDSSEQRYAQSRNRLLYHFYIFRENKIILSFLLWLKFNPV